DSHGRDQGNHLSRLASRLRRVRACPRGVLRRCENSGGEGMSSVTFSGDHHAESPTIYGLAAQFGSVEAVMSAAERVRDAGYTKTDAYTPFPVEGLDEALGMAPTRLGWIVLAAGIAGGLGGFFMQWWANTTYFPLIIGGKPLNSWPNWIVI